MTHQPTATPITALLQSLRAYLTRQKLSLVSRKLYLVDIKKFLLSLGQADLLPSDLQRSSAYTDYLAAQAASQTTASARRTLAALRQLGAFVAATYGVADPVTHLSLVKAESAESKLGFENYIKTFTNYLNSLHLSPLTIKSYKSDVSRYLAWGVTHLGSTHIPTLLTEKNYQKYATHLSADSQVSPATIERKLQSLARFQAYWASQSLTLQMSDKRENAPVHAESSSPLNSLTSLPEEDRSTAPTITSTTQPSVKKTNSRTPDRRGQGSELWNVRNFVMFAVLILFIGALGFFGYRQITRDRLRLAAAYPSTPVTPNRQLSFQGRLENSGGTPITAATNFVFKLFTASSGGTELYTSGTCSITPDADGVFNTQIGSTCGSAIASTVFTENANVWLEVTVGAETLSPRQQIATVAYALNAETLQGFPLSSTVSAIRNTVVPMNQYGEILVGEQSPKLTGVSGTFQISAPALTFTTTTGTNGNITLAPDGTGQVNVNGNTTTTNFFNVSNAQLTTGSLITGTVGNNNTGYKLLDLLSGSSPTSKFSVSDAGLTTVAADLYVGSGISLYGTAVSDDTVEAAKFCTGDGETNCVTDFSSLAGATYWTRTSGNLSPTNLNDTISATTSAATALTVTQTGAFNALLVEDQASDPSPFVIDQNGNVGAGTTGPDAKLDALSTSGEQLRLTYTDGSVYTGFTVNSGGDLTIDPTGGDVSLGSSDNLNLSAATNLIFGGTTSLGETTANTDSGAYVVGAYDEFNNSNSTNVQAVLKDLDTAITSAASGSWTLAGDSGASQTISPGNTATFTGGTGITTAASATDTLTLAFASTELGNLTWGSGSGYTWTFDAGATDPTLAFASNTLTATAGTINLAGTVNLAGGSGSTGCTVDDATGNLACTGTVTGSGITASAVPFSGISSATNTSAAMVVGTGASLNFTGSGTINASTLLSGTWAIPGAIGATTPNAGTFTTLGSTGDTTLGDATTDTITFTGRVAQDADLLPIGTTGTNDLGSGALPWDNIYGVALYQNGNAVCDSSGANCPAGSANYWRTNLGTLSPVNDTMDVLIGANATASAKIAFTNIYSGTPTISLANQASNLAVKDNTAAALKIVEGANTYLDITTTNDAESFTLSLPSGGATSHTANIFTNNIAQTINLGTGTAVDTINIGTGGTGADIITIGSTNAGNVSVKSNAVLNLTGGANSVIDFPNFDVATTGSVTIAAGASYTGSGALSVAAGGAAQPLNLDAATSGAINIGNTSTGDVLIAGGSGSTGCTIANASGNLTCSGTISGSSVTASALKWNGLTDPDGNLTLAMGATTSTFNWSNNTTSADQFTYTLTNTGGTAGTDNLLVLKNAVSTATTGDLNTESLLLLDQADTTTNGTTVLDNAILITNSGGSTLTDAIHIGSGAQAITNGINMGGSTGLTTDIVLQNSESIDNNTDGTILLTAATTKVSADLQVTSNAYFANGTTYYVDNLGNAKFLDIIASDTGNPGLTVGNGTTGYAKVGGSIMYDAAGDLTLDSDSTQVAIADDLQVTGNDILDSGAATRITLGATTTLTNTTTTLSGTTTLTASSLATIDTAASTTWDATTVTLGGSATLNGGSAASGTLTLSSTSNATKGNIQFFSSSNTLDSSGNLIIAGDIRVNGNDIADSAGTNRVTLGATTTLTNTTTTLSGTTTLTASSLATLTASAALGITSTAVTFTPSSGTTETLAVATATTLNLFNTQATTINFGGAATTALNLGNGTGNYTAINLGSGTGTHTINIAGTGATAADTINIGTGGTAADTITIGNNASSTSIALTSGTGAQTYTSSATTGTTTTSAFVFNATGLTSGTGMYLTSGTSSTSSTLLHLNPNQTSGNIINVAYGSSRTLAGALTGLNLNVGTNVTATGFNVTGQSITMPAVTNTGASTYTYKAWTNTAGAIVQNTAAGTTTWTGLDVNMPNITQTTGTVTSTGVKITGGTVTSGTAYALTTSATAGNVGIGTTAPASALSIGDVGNAVYKVYIKGDSADNTKYDIVTQTSTSVTNFFIRDNGDGYLRAAAWAYGSDRRIKQNIDYDYVSNGLEKILALNPVRFQYINSDINQLGFIAQDVQTVIPEAVVVTDPTTGILGLKTDFIIPYLVKSIQQQNSQITALQNEVLDSEGDLPSIVADSQATPVYSLRDQFGNVIDKVVTASTAVLASVQAGIVHTTELVAEKATTPTLEVATITPLASASAVTIQGPVVIQSSEPPSNSEPPTPLLVVDGEIEAASVSARVATLQEVQADTITARDIVADRISANHIEGLDAKIATLSAGLSDQEVATITDRIKARLQELTNPAGTAADIPLPPESTSAASLQPDPSNLTPDSLASDSATLTSVSAEILTVSNYLAVIGQATITSLDVTSHLYTENLTSKTGTLALQAGGGTIQLADNTLVVSSTGEVMVNGNLTVTGKILAEQASVNKLEIGAPAEASGSALGQLLAIYNEQGESVATIDASGSANLAEVSTKLIAIAGAADSTSSATVTGNIASNATAGSATLLAGKTEITIESPYVNGQTLVYLTPTTNTENKVLFVKAKDTGRFTVAIDASASADISFNWWVIAVK